MMTVALLILTTSGCKQVYVNKESGEVITKDLYQTLPSAAQDQYSRAIQISEQSRKIIDKGGETVIAATPVIATLADLILPGAGTVLLSILGSFGVLYRKWKAPLNKTQTLLEAIQSGAYITGDVLNEFRKLYPDAWKNLSPMLTKRVEALQKVRKDFEPMMPDVVVLTSSDPAEKNKE